MSRSLRDRAAIAGIGQTEFSKESGRSELQLACEAVQGRARRRRASPPRDVDGLVTFTMDYERGDGGRAQPRHPELTLFTPHPLRRRRVRAAIVMQAAMAVATGVADVVVCYRAFNERSGHALRRRRRRASTTLPPWLVMVRARTGC